MTEEEYIFEELAGKLEYDAGMSRAEAEQKASEIIGVGNKGFVFRTIEQAQALPEIESEMFENYTEIDPVTHDTIIM